MHLGQLVKKSTITAASWFSMSLNGPMHYEGLLRVPCIVKGPDVPAGKVVDEPVSTLDLGPTFCDCGATAPLQTQHGQSLRPLIETDMPAVNLP